MVTCAGMCAQNVQEQFRGRGGAHAYNTIMLHSAPTIPSKLKFKWAAPELVEGALIDEPPGVVNPADSSLWPRTVYLSTAKPHLTHTLKQCRYAGCLWSFGIIVLASDRVHDKHRAVTDLAEADFEKNAVRNSIRIANSLTKCRHVGFSRILDMKMGMGRLPTRPVSLRRLPTGL